MAYVSLSAEFIRFLSLDYLENLLPHRKPFGLIPFCLRVKAFGSLRNKVLAVSKQHSIVPYVLYLMMAFAHHRYSHPVADYLKIGEHPSDQKTSYQLRNEDVLILLLC
ncbi:unnamed protein product [Periconia digitata]|uniref:Uncharacterized protein n=1 Tax=Periconia digitata TaxID=1303443 RepID=A0A9W4UD10_9PLEO|nr:unnamed protein product [Periconia digitata]